MTAHERPVFGQTAPPERTYQTPGYHGLPLMQLCVSPSPAITARGWPCHRCLANTAAPGAAVSCHFLRSRRP
jgi:hypothetical protein